jgi:hypothetical protein
MCVSCDEIINNSEDDKDLLLFTLAMLGGLIENYVEEGYADPVMYKTLTNAIKIAKKLGITELADRFATLQMEAGEAIENILAKQGVEMSSEEWSGENNA